MTVKTDFNTDKEMFVEYQIGILEFFLKDHVILKTGIMAAEIQLCHHKLNFYILKQKTVFKL